MDKLYMVILLLTIIPILICIKYARKVKSDVADSITRCLFFVTITIIGNIVFAFSQYQLVAYFMESVYLFFFDLVLIYILQYSQQYTRVFNEVSAFRIGCFIVAYLDGISLLLNTFFHHVFTLKKESYIGIQMHCISSKTIFYDLHYVFVYCLMFCVIASFLTKIMRISSFYRTKYIPIFVVLCVIMALNMACNVSGFPLDLSLPFFVFAAILICYLTLYRTPRELIDKTLSFVVTKMNNAVVCFDINQECAYANDHFRSMLSSTNDDFSKITQLIRRWINENDFQDQNSVETSSQWVIDGVTHYFDIEYRKIFAKKGEYIGFFLNFIDTTEKRLAFEKEKFLATHDALTGLYNQSYFATKVSEALQQTPDVDWLLLCSNIKDFKLINDLFGLEKGNEVLKMEADLLKKYCGKNAVYGRIGGDKFAVCILYDRSIAYYSDTILDKTIKEKQLVGDFDEAIEQKQFCMYLQPQMTSDGKMIGAEALVRWQHPKRGLIFPGDFIEIFERTGLIYRLDRFIWELAVQQLAKWQKEGRDELYISVNISTKDFQYMDVYQTITSLVERYGIIPSTLKLEITETAIMMGNAGELETIGRFRNYGFEVEIDDFGSGYSSLNTLKDIDVDVLKIDMGFLRTTRSERLERSMSILNMIISLSKVLGLSVVTEGVETKEQVSRLSQMGCGVYQGYYFSKPIPVHEFEERYM